jgi:hypothetical protein
MEQEERGKKLAAHNFWGELLALRDEQRKHLKGAIQVIRGASLPQEGNR